MAKTMDALRAKLLEDEQKKNNNGGGEGNDNASYPFWNIPDNQSATIRFLNDADDNNPYFWVEKKTIRLPFSGVVGGERPTSNEVIVQVPCVEMFGQVCPVTTALYPWWKDPAKKELASVYYRKVSYIYQGFVVNSPLKEDNVPENPIRRFIVNKSIHDLIKRSLSNPDFEELPIHEVGGRDFKITKTKQGQYANYSTSSWSFKTRALSENELIAIERFGLFNLSNYLGRKPDSDELAAIKSMFDDSVAGRPFDFESYGKYYRPYGKNDDSTGSTPTKQPISKAVVGNTSVETNDSEPTEVTSTKSMKPNTAEVLARLKNRTAAA